jgi:hypothetical protein
MWAGIIWLFRRNRTRRDEAPAPLVAAPAVKLSLDALFTPRAAGPDGPESRVERIATLVLSSGRIVACDPLVNPDTAAFERTVPPGRYPADASLAIIGPDHVRVAALRVVFTAAPVTSWELAIMPGEDTFGHSPGGAVGYGVDAGLGCFMDADTAVLLERASNAIGDAGSGANYYDDVLAAELADPLRPWCDHRPVANSDANVVITQSGWGDGIYPSYFGLDAEHRVVCLITSFDVI